MDRSARCADKHFNSHAPRGARHQRFLSQRPAPHFNSHAPRGARPSHFAPITNASKISTHTPLAGRDIKVGDYNLLPSHFNSHAPRGARRGRKFVVDAMDNISTHTPLAGRDRKNLLFLQHHTQHLGRTNASSYFFYDFARKTIRKIGEPTGVLRIISSSLKE